MIKTILAIGIGGAVGSLLRYFISVVAPRPTTGFPVSTFIVNIAGCFFSWFILRNDFKIQLAHHRMEIIFNDRFLRWIYNFLCFCTGKY